MSVESVAALAAQQFPPKFVERLGMIVPTGQLQQTLASFGGSSMCGFRVNTLRMGVDECLAALREQGIEAQSWDYLAEAFSVDMAQRELLVRSELFESGAIYVQNFSSMLPPALLQVEPGQEVLDLAAAPGGKTLHLAALMANRGRIAAVELAKSRFHRLRLNIERGNATLVDLYCKDGSRVGRQVPNRFDRVLLDAPCSSESRFDLAEPDSWRYWSEKKIQDMQRKQKQLLYSAVLAAKPGALIAYSTCSFAPEENEVVLAHLLKKFGDELSIESIDIPLANVQPGLTEWRGKTLNPAVGRARRILPSAAMDGFFIGLLRKRG